MNTMRIDMVDVVKEGLFENSILGQNGTENSVPFLSFHVLQLGLNLVCLFVLN